MDLDAELFTIFHPSALDLADTLEEVHLEVPDPYVNVPVTLTYHCTELLWMYRTGGFVFNSEDDIVPVR